MALNSMPTIYMEQFQDALHILAQQKQSRFRPFVSMGQVRGDMVYFDRIGSLTATALTENFADVVHDNPELTRIAVAPHPVIVPTQLSFLDISRATSDPTSAVLQTMVMALNREFDRQVYACLGAAAAYGHTGSSTEALPSAQKVLVNNHALDPDAGSGDVGLTFYKLLKAIEILEDAGVDLLAEEVCLACTPFQKAELMASVRGSSRDYITQATMETGMLSSFLGAKILDVPSGVAEPLVAGDRNVYLFAKRGVGGAMISDIELIMSEPAEKWKVSYMKAGFDAAFVRIDPKLVVQIACNV